MMSTYIFPEIIDVLLVIVLKSADDIYFVIVTTLTFQCDRFSSIFCQFSGKEM